MNDKANFLRDLDEAGFVEDRPQDMIVVNELKDRYVFIHIERFNDEYTVGEFFKSTPTRMADFAGLPLAICKDFEEASKHMNNFIEDIS